MNVCLADPTGFNPGFGQGFNSISSVPPVPPLPSSPVSNTNPANIFAQMKSGTFANDNDSAAQDADKYNALRPNRKYMTPPSHITVNNFAIAALIPQATGWGGYQGSFGGGYR